MPSFYSAWTWLHAAAVRPSETGRDFAPKGMDLVRPELRSGTSPDHKPVEVVDLVRRVGRAAAIKQLDKTNTIMPILKFTTDQIVKRLRWVMVAAIIFSIINTLGGQRRAFGTILKQRFAVMDYRFTIQRIIHLTFIWGMAGRRIS